MLQKNFKTVCHDTIWWHIHSHIVVVVRGKMSNIGNTIYRIHLHGNTWDFGMGDEISIPLLLLTSQLKIPVWSQGWLLVSSLGLFLFTGHLAFYFLVQGKPGLTSLGSHQSDFETPVWTKGWGQQSAGMRLHGGASIMLNLRHNREQPQNYYMYFVEWLCGSLLILSCY